MDSDPPAAARPVRFDLIVANGSVLWRDRAAGVAGSQAAADAEAALQPARLQHGVDVGIRDGKVCAVAPGLAAAAAAAPGDAAVEVVDATGLLVVPGGVDSHCHIEQRTSTGLVPCDDFRGASLCALAGGTTTIVPFACQHRGDRLRDVVREYRVAAAKACCDVAMHVIVTDPAQDECLADLAEVYAEGITSVKVYMTYDALRLADGELLDVLAACRRLGALLMVHAESHDMIHWITQRLLQQGLGAAIHHATARHPIAEREATHRAASFAEFVQTPMLIVHVSGEEAVAEVARARGRGAPLFGETCPQYLTLTRERLAETAPGHTPHDEGAKYLCSPPLRDAASVEALWRGLREGALDVVSSDHSAYRFKADPANPSAVSKEHFGPVGAGATPFSRAPMGLPGLETRLPLLFSEGVLAGRLGAACTHDPPRAAGLDEATVRRFVEVVSETPARLYGLFPRKGVICAGADADLVLLDPSSRGRVRHADLHDTLDYTPYEGLPVRGHVVATLLRGRVTYRAAQEGAQGRRGSLVEPRAGRFVAGGTPDVRGFGWPAEDSWPNDRDAVLERAHEVTASLGE